MEVLAWNPQSKIVTPEDLELLCTRHHLVVLHCGAIWNTYDTRMDAFIQQLKIEFEDRIGFYALDFDDKRNRDLFHHTNVVTIPSLLCFAGGVWQDSLVGLRTLPEIRAKLEVWLADAKGHPD